MLSFEPVENPLQKLDKYLSNLANYGIEDENKSVKSLRDILYNVKSYMEDMKFPITITLNDLILIGTILENGEKLKNIPSLKQVLDAPAYGLNQIRILVTNLYNKKLAEEIGIGHVQALCANQVKTLSFLSPPPDLTRNGARQYLDEQFANNRKLFNCQEEDEPVVIQVHGDGNCFFYATVISLLLDGFLEPDKKQEITTYLKQLVDENSDVLFEYVKEFIETNSTNSTRYDSVLSQLLPKDYSNKNNLNNVKETAIGVAKNNKNILSDFLDFYNKSDDVLQFINTYFSLPSAKQNIPTPLCLLAALFRMLGVKNNDDARKLGVNGGKGHCEGLLGEAGYEVNFYEQDRIDKSIRMIRSKNMGKIKTKTSILFDSTQNHYEVIAPLLILKKLTKNYKNSFENKKRIPYDDTFSVFNNKYSEKYILSNNKEVKVDIEENPEKEQVNLIKINSGKNLSPVEEHIKNQAVLELKNQEKMNDDLYEYSEKFVKELLHLQNKIQSKGYKGDLIDFIFLQNTTEEIKKIINKLIQDYRNLINSDCGNEEFLLKQKKIIYSLKNERDSYKNAVEFNPTIEDYHDFYKKISWEKEEKSFSQIVSDKVDDNEEKSSSNSIKEIHDNLVNADNSNEILGEEGKNSYKNSAEEEFIIDKHIEFYKDNSVKKPQENIIFEDKKILIEKIVKK